MRTSCFQLLQPLFKFSVFRDHFNELRRRDVFLLFFNTQSASLTRSIEHIFPSKKLDIANGLFSSLSFLIFGQFILSMFEKPLRKNIAFCFFMLMYILTTKIYKHIGSSLILYLFLCHLHLFSVILNYLRYSTKIII